MYSHEATADRNVILAGFRTRDGVLNAVDVTRESKMASCWYKAAAEKGDLLILMPLAVC